MRTRPCGSVAALARWRECSLLLPQRAAPAQAAPGDLDLTFSGDGKQTTDFGFGLSSAAATVRQPDGKIVAVGSRFAHRLRRRLRARPLQPERLARHELLRRRQADDRLRGRSDEATGVALQADGKIVVVGTTGGVASGDFALARYNPNGSLDTSFSGDGKQTTDFGGFDGASGVALQGDGKIVAVGADWRLTGARRLRARPLQPERLARHELLRRRQADDRLRRRRRPGERGGAPGRRQDRRGRARRRSLAGATSRSPATTRTARSTRASPATASRRPTSGAATGRTGWRSRATARSSRSASGGTGRGDFALARYNPNGSLDTSFSGDGKQTTDFGGVRRGDRGGAPGRRQDRRGRRTAAAVATTSRSPATTRTARSTRASPATASRRPTSGARRGDGVALQGDGKIVAVGGRRRRRRRDFALARYNPNGSLDTSFSGDGKQTTDFGGFDAAAGVALQGDGKIVAVGDAGRVDADFALARYNPNGSLDTSFSGDGKQTTDFGGVDEATGVAIQGDGKIVVVGARGRRSRHATSRSPATTRTARSTRASPATASRRPTSGASTRATGVALQGDGKIVVVGVGGRRRRRLRARPLQPERLARHELLRRRQADDRLRGAPTGRPAVALQGDGKIVVVGGAGGDSAATSRSPATTPTARSTRASPATASRRPTSGARDGATGVALQGDGKIVAVGGRQRRRRLRARPLQPQRLARHELLRRRQADDRLRGQRRGERGGAPGRRQDRRGRPRRASAATTSRSPATTRTGRSTRASPATASRRPTSGAEPDRRGDGVALQGDGKIVAVGHRRVARPRPDDFALARYLGAEPASEAAAAGNAALGPAIDYAPFGPSRTDLATSGPSLMGAAGFEPSDLSRVKRAFLEVSEGQNPALTVAPPVRGEPTYGPLATGDDSGRKVPSHTRWSAAEGGMTRESHCLAAGTCAESIWWATSDSW